MKRKKYFANVFFNITFYNVVYLQDRIENIYSIALIFAQFGTFEICGTNFCDLHIDFFDKELFFFITTIQTVKNIFSKFYWLFTSIYYFQKNQYKG